jgi:hypothetical protein
MSQFKDTTNGTTTLEYSNGAIEDVYIYIDATGGTPNSSFLSGVWLDERRRVITDLCTLRVVKASGVYCIGDFASYSKGGVLYVKHVEHAVAPLCYSLWYDLHMDRKQPAAKHVMKEKRYEQVQSDMALYQLNRKG